MLVLPHTSLPDHCNMSFKIQLGCFLQEDSLDTSGLVFPDMPISRTLLTLSPTQMNVCLLAHYPQLEGKDLEHQALEGEQQ